MIIHYGSLDQLDDILHRLSHESHGAGPPGAGPDPAEATDVFAAAAPGPIPETAAEEPSEPEIPEDSEEPAGEGAEGADESPSAAGGDRGPEADRPDDPPATDKTE